MDLCLFSKQEIALFNTLYNKIQKYNFSWKDKISKIILYICNQFKSKGR